MKGLSRPFAVQDYRIFTALQNKYATVARTYATTA